MVDMDAITRRYTERIGGVYRRLSVVDEVLSEDLYGGIPAWWAVDYEHTIPFIVDLDVYIAVYHATV